MPSVTSGAEWIHLGMDVSKDAIVVGVLHPGEEVPVVDRIFNDEASLRRLVGRFRDRSRLAACYEAGPGGYELHRLLTSMGVACDVVAPSLIPKGAGERVKTDRRDAIRLARLHRAGELTAIRVPTIAEEAVRDLVRTRADLLDDRRRAQQRINAFLLRHGRVWRGGVRWTKIHRQWVASQVFDEPALTATLATYRAALMAREAELAALEAQLHELAQCEPLHAAVSRLGCYRGIAELTALTLAAEVVDWHRFASARAFMSYSGLIPTEYSSGDRIRRGGITKAGSEPVRTALTESAWSYQHRPTIGAPLRRRQQDATAETLARSWKAQQRLCGKFRRMAKAGKSPAVTVVAVARELAGFVWAEMTS
ncbi:IS110 family transposase [Microbispora sp. SCL1-1]|nr:IS110 family transposase [Microbispora sp. SCL1-1]